jgi:hypothetical protein
MKRKSIGADRRRRKMITILWTALLAIGTIILIYKEMTAVLYILATVGVTILLVVVAKAHLSPDDKPTASAEPGGEAAAIGGLTSTFGSQKQ